jgi:UrcA family protein
MKTTQRKKLYTAVSCLLGTMAATGAMTSARAHEETHLSKVVHFDGLDLASPAGAKVLYHRIQAAAREVCTPAPARDLAAEAAEHACIETAVDQAVRQVNSVQLTELRFGTALRVASK